VGVITELGQHPGTENRPEPRLTPVDLNVRVPAKTRLHLALQHQGLAGQLADHRKQRLRSRGVSTHHTLLYLIFRQVLGLALLTGRTSATKDVELLWYALHGHAPDDVTSHRARARWYTTKTEPSYDDMTVKLHRVIIAARFRGPCPEQATPQETRAVLAAWADAET
jgi:hypothetical protein